MDILIKNLKIPKEKYIRVEIHHDGTLYVQKSGYYSFYVKSHDKAIELPPHGDLIQRDNLYEFIEKNEEVTVGEIYDFIQDAPTIVEASK